MEHFEVWMKGATRDKAFARAKAMGLIPSSRPGCVEYGLVKGPAALPMILLNISEARRHLRGLSPSGREGNDERAWKWLSDRYGQPVALDIIDRFERTDGPCLCFPPRKGDVHRYKLYVEPILTGEHLFLFAGME